MIKLIALDIDGTLARSDRSVSDTTRETLLEAQQRGVRLCIASGRPTHGIRSLAEQLKLERYGGFVLAFNGAEVWDWQSGRCLYARRLPADVIPLLCECVRSAGLEMMTYCGREIVTEARDNRFIALSSARNGMVVSQVEHFLDAVEGQPLTKCMIVGEAERLEAFEPILKERLQGRANAYRSEPFYLEVVPRGIDKAECLTVLLKELDLKREELMACGDGYNDIGMVRLAGIGVAMGNGADEIKKAADFITRSNDDDGVALAVRRFVLDG